MPYQYQFIDHTADIAVKGSGRDLAEAFAAAAAAMFDIITDSSEIAERDELTISVQSIDLEGLLVSFLSELIVFHDAENWLFGRFEIEMISDKQLNARLFGEKFDPARHRAGTPVKGISYHMMEIVDGGPSAKSYTTVLFDI